MESQAFLLDNRSQVHQKKGGIHTTYASEDNDPGVDGYRWQRQCVGKPIHFMHSSGHKGYVALIISGMYWLAHTYVLGSVRPYWPLEIGKIILFFGSWVYLIDWLVSLLIKRKNVLFKQKQGLFFSVVTMFLVIGLALVFTTGFSLVERLASTVTQLVPVDLPIGLTFWGLSEPTTLTLFTAGLTIPSLVFAFGLTTHCLAHQQIQRQRLRTKQLQAETELFRFDTLKHQTNAHFLFSNLQLIFPSIKANPVISIQLIKQLTKSYRYLITKQPVSRVTLDEELDFIVGYQWLLQTRFTDQFCVIMDDVLPTNHSFQLVPLTLKLLVDNAIRYNQLSYEVPLLVSIDMEPDYLVVSNLVRPRSPTESSSGLGLSYLIQAYRQQTSKPVLIINQANVFMVKIPLLM